MHKFQPENAQRLEQPERYHLIPPGETLQRFGLRSGMRFLDVGAGTGFFSKAAAEIIGPQGKVYAVDSSPEMLRVLRSGATNPVIETLLSQEYSISLSDEAADMALLAFVVHETPDQRRLVDEVMRILVPDGRILIIEWKKQKEDIGPPMEERLGEEELLRALEPFTVVERGSLNGSHYYAILQRRTGPLH